MGLERIIKAFRKIPILNFFPRMYLATSYFNSRYIQILKWGFSSREDTNLTYSLTVPNLKCLACTISIVTKTPYKTVLGYVLEPIKNKELNDFVIEKTKNKKFASITDNRCEFGRRLGWYAFARILKPKILIETGVEKGMGSVLLCSALLKNKEEGFLGHYYGTDIDINAGFLLDGKYKDVGEILYGDSIQSLQNLDCKIDLFVNDSDHSEEYEYREYLTIRNKLNKRAIVLGDNSLTSDKLLRFSLENDRNFLFFKEIPKDHWYPGCGIGISYEKEIG